MSLSDIVTVTITTSTAAPSRVGFGIPLVMSYHTVFPERARTYTSVAAMITDGFAATDPAVVCVTALLAQNPKPSYVVVGREALTSTMNITITPIARNSTDYTLYVDGNEVTVTSDATATVAEITALLKIDIDLLAIPGLTCTDNTTDIALTTAAASNNVIVYADNRTLLQQDDNQTDGGIATDIAAVIVENDDWYTCHVCTHSYAVILATAIYIETLYKLHLATSADSVCYDDGSTTDIAAALQTAGYARTALVYHPKAMSQHATAAWAGKCLPQDPGSITWKFKAVSGVDYCTFTSTEEATLKDKNCNAYVRIAGISMFQEGVTSSGEFIDVVRGVDFIRARLQEYIFGALANAAKIPFTDPGVGVIEAQVWAVLRLAVGNSILTSDSLAVTVPAVADVSATDKANRLLPDVTFSGTLAGAIHATQVSGTISV